MVGFLKHPAVIHFESHGFWSSGERGMFSTYQGQNGRRVNFYHEHHNGGEIYIWIGNEAVLADVLSKQSGTFSTKTTYCLNPKKSKLFFLIEILWKFPCLQKIIVIIIQNCTDSSKKFFFGIRIYLCSFCRKRGAEKWGKIFFTYQVSTFPTVIYNQESPCIPNAITGLTECTEL